MVLQHQVCTDDDVSAVLTPSSLLVHNPHTKQLIKLTPAIPTLGETSQYNTSAFCLWHLGDTNELMTDKMNNVNVHNDNLFIINVNRELWLNQFPECSADTAQ